MSYKPDEATLVSYLYGELEGETQKKVEEYLLQNPEDKKRLDEWSFSRKVMASLEDKEVIAPPIILGEDGRRPLWRENYFRMTIGIAASFLFLLVAAKMLGLSASYSPGELKIGFGSGGSASTPTLNEQQVGSMIQSSLASNNESLKASWSDDRKMLEESIQKNLNLNSKRIDDLMHTASTANQQQVREFVTHLQDDNLKLMKDYLALSSEGQKEYIENLLLDFSKYLQEQRKQDLQLFQARMNRVEENTDQFKQETEQILTSFITNTGTDNQKRN